MKSRSMVLLLVAGGCGLVASVAVTQHLAGKQTDPVAPAGEPVKRVVVAASDQEAGTKLKAEMLTVVEMPAKDLPEGTYTDVEKVTGETLRVPVFKRDPVLASKLGGEKSLAFLTKQLPPGMRLGTVHVDDADAHMTGLINPGDFVDVFWKPGKPDIVPGTVKTLMQNVKVLAVGQRVTAGDSDLGTSKENKSNEHNFTLLVTAEQNHRLIAAGSAGKIRLEPRGQQDKALELLDENALDIMLGLKAAPKPVIQQTPEPPPAPPEPEKYEIEIINGGEFSTQQFDNPRHGRIHGNR